MKIYAAGERDSSHLWKFKYHIELRSKKEIFEKYKFGSDDLNKIQLILDTDVYIAGYEIVGVIFGDSDYKKIFFLLKHGQEAIIKVTSPSRILEDIDEMFSTTKKLAEVLTGYFGRYTRQKM